MFLFFLQAVGLAVVVLGSWMLTDKTFLVSLSEQEQHYNMGLYVLLGAGILIIVVSFLGCCGAFKESQCMLVTFFSLLLVVIVAQIAAGAWLYTNRERLDELVKDSFAETVKVIIFSVVNYLILFYFSIILQELQNFFKFVSE